MVSHLKLNEVSNLDISPGRSSQSCCVESERAVSKEHLVINSYSVWYAQHYLFLEARRFVG